MTATTPDQPRYRVRVGRKVGRTLYQQVGPEPSDADVLIGMVDTPQWAAFIADCVNMRQFPLPAPEPSVGQP